MEQAELGNRQQTPNAQHPTPKMFASSRRTLNPELRRRAAEGAGERGGNVGSQDLLGRFVGRWFFTG
jgi:hypothetical protein